MNMRWITDNTWTLVSGQQFVADFLASFKEFLPRRGSSLSVDNVLKEMFEQNPSTN